MSVQPRPTRQPHPDHADIGPDGQRIVHQQHDRNEEQADIAQASERQEANSRVERAREPSTRFWSSRRVQAGPVLALLAGVITLAIRTWPIAVPQGRGMLGTTWFLAATLIGVAYIVGFFLADRRWQLARTVLVLAAVVHLVVGFGSGAIVQVDDLAPGPLAMLFDVVPALLALVAAFLIRPAPATMHDH